MPSLLEQLSNRRRAIDEATGDYTASPSTLLETPATEPQASVQAAPQLPEGFSGLPKRKAIVRRNEDGTSLWSPFSKMWIPVKTVNHEGVDYWFDAADNTFYPIQEESI